MADTVILAYSGGLDTSVAIRWIREKYGLDVIAVTVDVGNERDFEAIREKALRTGAIKAFVEDARAPVRRLTSSFRRSRRTPSTRAPTRWRPRWPDR